MTCRHMEEAVPGACVGVGDLAVAVRGVAWVGLGVAGCVAVRLVFFLWMSRLIK